MAAVFRAMHLGTGRLCALKIVHPHIVEQADIREMFVQEARLGARIGKNPHIVDVFDAGIDLQRGVPFLAMDLLEGNTLEEHLKRHGPVPPGLLRLLFLQLADALAQAHAAGVVHRDLKPGNLFLTYDRKRAPLLKVVDFGIAKFIEGGMQRNATQVGTPAYAAPEQFGASTRPIAEQMGITIAYNITPMTDVWALGVIAYELLVGSPPGHLWTGVDRSSLTEIMMSVAFKPTPSAVAHAGDRAHLLPRGFDGWLDRCLRKNATERWQSADEAVRTLVDLIDAGHDHGDARRSDPRISPEGAHQMPIQTTPAGGVALPRALSRAVLPSGHNLIVDPTASPLPVPLSQPLPPSLQTPIADASRSVSPEPSRVVGTAHGLSGTKPPVTSPRQNRALLALGSLALLGAIGVGIFVLVSGKTKGDVAMTSTPMSAPMAERPVQPAQRPLPALEEITPPPTATGNPEAPPPSEISSSAPMGIPPPVPDPTSSAPAGKRGLATLNINSIPVSNVVLDGRPLGTTPKVRLSLQAGSHTVLFVHPKKGKKTVTVILKPGETKTASVRFDERGL